MMALGLHRLPGRMALVLLASVLAASGAQALELPDLGTLDSLRTAAARNRVQVDSIELVGSETLRRAVEPDLLEPYLGRALSPRELTDLRDALTARLIKAGFVTSGARITQDALIGTRLEVELVPGRLDSVSI